MEHQSKLVRFVKHNHIIMGLGSISVVRTSITRRSNYVHIQKSLLVELIIRNVIEGSLENIIHQFVSDPQYNSSLTI